MVRERYWRENVIADIAYSGVPTDTDEPPAFVCIEGCPLASGLRHCVLHRQLQSVQLRSCLPISNAINSISFPVQRRYFPMDDAKSVCYEAQIHLVETQT
jgi:hypothetical protein